MNYHEIKLHSEIQTIVTIQAHVKPHTGSPQTICDHIGYKTQTTISVIIINCQFGIHFVVVFHGGN